MILVFTTKIQISPYISKNFGTGIFIQYILYITPIIVNNKISK